MICETLSLAIYIIELFVKTEEVDKMRCDNISESQPLSRQTSILTPAQTLPETLLFVLISVRVRWKPVLSNRSECKCERVQICVRLVLDSEMTPVQTAHQTWGHVGQSRSRYLVEFRCEL